MTSYRVDGYVRRKQKGVRKKSFFYEDIGNAVEALELYVEERGVIRNHEVFPNIQIVEEDIS